MDVRGLNAALFDGLVILGRVRRSCLQLWERFNDSPEPLGPEFVFHKLEPHSIIGPRQLRDARDELHGSPPCARRSELAWDNLLGHGSAGLFPGFGLVRKARLWDTSNGT